MSEILGRLENATLEDCVNMFELGNAVMLDNGELVGYIIGSEV